MTFRSAVLLSMAGWLALSLAFGFLFKGSRRSLSDFRRDRFGPLDGVLLAGLAVCAALLVYHQARSAPLPADDAAMLMRYSQNFAQGNGIVWNPGEQPVDGATDFLFMLLVGLGMKAGLGALAAVFWLNFSAHLATVLLVYTSVRLFTPHSRLVGLLSALPLVMGPAPAYIAAAFGTPFFAFSAALSWVLALAVIHKPSAGRAWAFALASLGMGLTRPEGVILAGLFVASIWVQLGWQRARRVLVIFAGVFAVLGGAYFLWHWAYFGYPLPNPFYKKGGGMFYPRSLRASLGYVFTLGLPFMALAAAGFWHNRRRQQRAFWGLALVVGGFTCAWVLLSDEMNFLMRFQYPLLPVILISWSGFFTGSLTLGVWWGWLRRNLANPLKVAGAFALAVILAEFFLQAYLPLTRYTHDSCEPRYQMAQTLQRYQGKGYTIAATEAGLLPFYSGWRALDTWGLNDAYIAHRGIITREYLASFRPDVIMFHAYYSPRSAAMPSAENDWLPGWSDMLAVVKGYADEQGYILAAAYGFNPNQADYYYVRADFADSAALVEDIRTVDYCQERDYAQAE